MTRCSPVGRKRLARGFTYLWVLALVVMLAAGFVISAEIYETSAARDKEEQLLFIGHEFRNAIDRYHATQVAGSNHEYPARIEQLLRDDRFPDVRRHLRRLYTDPITGKAEWGVVRMAGRIVGVHSLSEATPIKQASFDAEDADFAGVQHYSAWVFGHSMQNLKQPEHRPVRGLTGTSEVTP